MNCLDCSILGETRPAVGVCIGCGAAVCLECVHVGHQPIRRLVGVVARDRSTAETRRLACPACAAALSTRDGRQYRFVTPVSLAVEMP